MTIPQSREGLSGDAWATLVAALIAAAVAIIVGVLQRHWEQRDKRNEMATRGKAICTAFLYEIDRFYRFYIAGLLVPTLVSPIADLESPGSSPFPVYAGNCGHVGELDATLAAAIADFYASAQRYAFRLCDYAERRNGPNFNQIPGLLSDVKSRAKSLVPLAYIACACLCVYTGTRFTAAQFETAKHEYMSDVTLQSAHDAIEAYRAKLKR
ncbi:MAG: hypothetical protein WA876_09795 [Candidatus Acidiferrales bacterium]